jgi:hypothetical protein
MNAENHALTVPEPAPTAPLDVLLAQVVAQVLNVKSLRNEGRRVETLPEFLDAAKTYVNSASPVEYQFHISRARAHVSKCRHLGLQLSAIAALTQINGVPEAAESLNGFVHQLKETSDTLLHNVQFTGDLLSYVGETCVEDVAELQALLNEVTLSKDPIGATEVQQKPHRNTFVDGLSADCEALERRSVTIGKIAKIEQAQVLTKAQVNRFIVDAQALSTQGEALRKGAQRSAEVVAPSSQRVEVTLEQLIHGAQTADANLARPRREFAVVSQLLDVLTLETRKLRNTSVNAGILSSKHGAGGAALLVLAESVREAVRTLRGMVEQLKDEITWLQSAVDHVLQPPEILANGSISFAAQDTVNEHEIDDDLAPLLDALHQFTGEAQRFARATSSGNAQRSVFVRSSQSDPATSRWAQSVWHDYTSQAEREVHLALYGKPSNA